MTGVIDVNPPALTGDRAFDLATLLFYVHDHDVLRERVRNVGSTRKFRTRHTCGTSAH